MGELFILAVKAFLYFGVPWIVITFVIKISKEFEHIHRTWHHLQFDHQFNTDEIYSAVKDLIESKYQLPAVRFEESTYYGDSFFSENRRYLKVLHRHSMVLLFAGQYGTGYFVSWRAGDTVNFLQKFVASIPFIGEKLEKLIYTKSYYQLDSEDMFTDAVRQCIMEVIDSMTKDKGIRPLSEFERRPIQLQTSGN